jgi:putative transcriptional regulator
MKNRIRETEGNFEGCILVAAPNQDSPNYAQAVCLLVHHSQKGSVGVFLNRSFTTQVPDIWQHLAGQEVPQSARRPIHFGGPMSGPVIALHNRRELAEYTTADGVYIAAQVNHLQQLVQLVDESEVRLIVGQATWQPGELEAELKAGKWYPMAVTPQLVFASDDEMWGKAMREIGNRYVAAICGAKGQPENLLLN